MSSDMLASRGGSSVHGVRGSCCPVATGLCKNSAAADTDEDCSHRGEKTRTGGGRLIVTECQVKHQLLVNRDCVPAVM